MPFIWICENLKPFNAWFCISYLQVPAGSWSYEEYEFCICGQWMRFSENL